MRCATASKAHEASVCATPDGSLVASIMGAKIPDTAAMKRGRTLESSVRKVVSRKLNKKIATCGLYISRENPIIAASPDGIVKDAVIEIKCPTKVKTRETYLYKKRCCHREMYGTSATTNVCNWCQL